MSEQFIPGPQGMQEQRPTRVFQENEGHFYPHPNDHEISTVVREGLENIRTEVISLLEPSEEGLDLDRVRAFVAESGLAGTDLYIVDGSLRDQVLDTLKGKYGLAYDEPQGFFDKTLKLAVVFRDDDLERLNGPAFTETLAIHELAHGSSGHDLVVVAAQTAEHGQSVPLKTLSPRSGQAVQNIQDHSSRGLFIEEGFAELVRAEYISDSLGLDKVLAQWTVMSRARPFMRMARH